MAREHQSAIGSRGPEGLPLKKAHKGQRKSESQWSGVFFATSLLPVKAEQ